LKEQPMPAQFYLPALPFDTAALAPAISSETFAMHHGGHHQAYVDKLNDLADKKGFTKADLLSIIRDTADADPDEVRRVLQRLSRRGRPVGPCVRLARRPPALEFKGGRDRRLR